MNRSDTEYLKAVNYVKVVALLLFFLLISQTVFITAKYTLEAIIGHRLNYRNWIFIMVFLVLVFVLIERYYFDRPFDAIT